MKLAIISNSLGLGGGEKIALNINNKILSSDCFKEVLFFTFDKGNLYSSPSNHVQCNKKSRVLSIITLFFYVFKFRPDVIQSHLLISNLINVVVSLIIGSKSQIVSHGSIKLLSSRWYFPLIKFFYKRASQIVCISDGMKHDAINIIGNDNVVVINNPHDIDDIINNSYCIDYIEQSDYFCVLGRLNKGKRIEDIINAFYQSKKSNFMKLYLIGDGDKEYVTKLKDIVRNLNIKDKVIFLGRRKNPYPIIKQSKALILASESEGYPNCLIEALILNVPVITSDCHTGPREILKIDDCLDIYESINIGGNFIFPTGNINELKKSIEKISLKEKHNYSHLYEHLDINNVIRVYISEIMSL
ncbi:glycosyltransferase [Vibrio parahaemolyticus]|uniref:N-acetylgalactosamine-N, N'-diacetylbacillosaminyl-diphospho-undecaprenol 4-alpha-N-acetylgalactosaminyltransferase n=1 Tax=Vibrio parahaemolyticus TaxID=670 RepID=A0A7M1VV22_VIBPH|nr:glycosyltransferase [Vibrio parahaemolyticus]EJB8583597.1 glycosyltransferase [Vibrio parahaemolyticus]QOS19060.1 N-acetylgalactosamine-N,N'-diacetylbacillosaminyl-diphospho-undecaprenol 4-alpha-N-acetylgalactosaminyltransferase [Vibrio parahaemolyticus]